jgi:cytochrome c-type biogenesis protein CcmE
VTDDTGTTPTGPPASGSLADLDLTPREPPRPAAQARRRRSWRNVAVLSVLALVLGFVLYQALSSARVYFLNVDEAVERRRELDDQNFRMQGELVRIDGIDGTGAMLFTLAFADATAQVRHVGDEPSGLFEIGQKIVVDGYWDGEVFLSNQILVKHSEEYVEDNPDRLDYEIDGTTPVDS